MSEQISKNLNGGHVTIEGVKTKWFSIDKIEADIHFEKTDKGMQISVDGGNAFIDAILAKFGDNVNNLLGEAVAFLKEENSDNAKYNESRRAEREIEAKIEALKAEIKADNLRAEAAFEAAKREAKMKAETEAKDEATATEKPEEESKGFDW